MSDAYHCRLNSARSFRNEHSSENFAATEGEGKNREKMQTVFLKTKSGGIVFLTYCQQIPTMKSSSVALLPVSKN